MSLLEQANGPQAYEELARKREANRSAEATRRAEVAERLARIATPEGVVKPSDSVAVHSGEVPVVDVSREQ